MGRDGYLWPGWQSDLSKGRLVHKGQDIIDAGKMSGRQGTALFVVFVLLGSIALIALLYRTELFSADYPWLLRMGQWIIDHHSLPVRDPFSWTTVDRPLVPHQWLLERLGAAIDRLAGP